MAPSSPFWRRVDATHTALLLIDVQTQLLAHMPEDEQTRYLGSLQELLDSFRTSISTGHDQSQSQSQHGGAAAENHHGGRSCIIHHVVVMDHATMNLSPTNKLNNWALKRLQAAGPNRGAAKVLTDPAATVPSTLHAPNGWNMDEFVLTKQAPPASCRRRC